jgi:hypothetical protein
MRAARAVSSGNNDTITGHGRKAPPRIPERRPIPLVVRSFLLPSLIALLGRWLWWPSRPPQSPAGGEVVTDRPSSLHHLAARTLIHLMNQRHYPNIIERYRIMLAD